VGFYVVHQVSGGRPNLILQPPITTLYTKNPNFYFSISEIINNNHQVLILF